MAFYAHISKDGRTQTVKEHLENTAKLAASFAKPFGIEEHAYSVGLLHDIGKYSKEFQRRINGVANIKVDHSTAGAVEAVKRGMIIESLCIAGHHAGLPNVGSRTECGGSSLIARLRRAKDDELPDYSRWMDEINVEPLVTRGETLGLGTSFKVRMIFSCLVDADYLDTEEFMDGHIERGMSTNIDTLRDRLGAYIKPWFPANDKLNALRCDILNHLLKEGRSKEKGLYTLTVPTGGGKTVSSLAFALEHAKRNNLRRIIYVIPYTSIIEQTAEIFRNVLGDDVVLEHHSNVELDDSERSLFYLKASENWDIPVVVTTSVQFFESFYKNKPSSSRKLHNIANSVIIFDEAQMLPVPFIKPCIALLTELIKQFNSSIVLCTATQPSLGSIIKEFYSDYSPYELCPRALYDDDLFKRTKFIFDTNEAFSCKTLADLLNNQKQCLCIVNSRRTAQMLFKLMDSADTYHLSTSMYSEHRKRVLTEIRKKLSNNEPCRVISTSLIEAGVDVDFPCVYRQMAGLDSIIQAGGRCNREGKRGKDESIVHIFELEESSGRLFSLQAEATRAVAENHKDITSKEAVSEYFERLFGTMANGSLDREDIISLSSSATLPLKDIADRFNIIDNMTRTLYIVNDITRPLLEKIHDGTSSKQDSRTLSRFGISIYAYQFAELMKRGVIKKLMPVYSVDETDFFSDCILEDMSLYSEQVGLNLLLEQDDMYL